MLPTKCNTVDALTEILNSIDKKNKLVSIYVSIGSAASNIKMDNSGRTSIDPKFEQQFPPFLKSLKEELPFEPLHIILIDPLLESPPFITWGSKGQELCHDWTETFVFKRFGIKSYFNSINNIYVYAINDTVKYSPILLGTLSHTNIDKFINELNILSMINKWFCVLNDFSGRQMSDVAIYHDKLLEEHIDHIVYGLGARKDGGCYLDITKPECNFVYIISPNNGIRVYNPFKNENNADIELVRSLKQQALSQDASEKVKKQYEIIKAQIWQYIKQKRKFIMMDLMTLIRQFGMLAHNKISDIAGIKLDNQYIENNYCPELQNMLKNKQYDDALNVLLNILRIELRQHLSVIYSDDTELVIEHTITEMLACENPYKWYNFIKKIIDHFDDQTGIKINLMEVED